MQQEPPIPDDGGGADAPPHAAASSVEPSLDALARTPFPTFKGKPPAAVYPYVDEDGAELFFVCRYQVSDDEKTFRQYRLLDGEWKPLGDQRRVLYRLPEVLEHIASNSREPLRVAEGEKDVDAIFAAGGVATTNPMGAGKWSDDYSELLRGARNVEVVVDLDPDSKRRSDTGLTPGEAHALMVRDSLRRVAGVDPALVCARHGKDAHDHLAAGHRLDDLQEWRQAGADDTDGSPATAPVDTPSEDPERPRLQFLSGPEFLAQPLMNIDPLVGTKGDALMMPGSLVILAGVGGAGKTTLVMHALAHWAAGVPWLGIPTARPLRIVVIENEGPHDPFVEKVRVFAERWHNCPCGGDHAAPHGNGAAFADNLLFLDSPWGHFTWEDEALAEELRQTAIGFQADLVVANPLGQLGMRGAGTPEETRAFLALLRRGGLGNDFAMILNHHMSKIGSKVPIVQQLSGDWGPHPDTILVMEPQAERKSKLTFGKVRWGDQGRDPLLLEWLTDESGPVGYRTKTVAAGIPDDLLFQRIDEFLDDQVEPVGLTEIRRAVQGNSKRISELAREGAKAGRYWSSGGHRPKFLAAAKAPRPSPQFEIGEEPEIPWQQ